MRSISKKTVIICLGIILCAILAGNLWRLSPPDPYSTRAILLYKEILQNTAIVGVDFSCLTTTLGSFAAKKVSADPFTAAIMVRLLRDAEVTGDSVVAINASGSFPGFVLAALAACAALGIDAYVIASIGSSTFGANVPGNTIADMLLKDEVRNLGHTLLAITPGGSHDRGEELDPQELQRISQMLEQQNIPFIRSLDVIDAITMREYLFSRREASLLINIGGGHASNGGNVDLALMSGIIQPDRHSFDGYGIIQSFLQKGIPVIQILNIRQLYAGYGLDFDEAGTLIGNRQRLLRNHRINQRQR